MNKRVVSVLGAIVLLLVAYLLVFERGQLTSKELADRKGRVLGSFVRDRVDEVTVVRGKTTLRLARSPLPSGELGSYRLTSPVADEADEGAVDGLLGELEWLSARRTIEAPTAADLKAFGLDAPSFELGYRASGTRHTLRVGKADVHGDSYYARLDDASRVLLVPKTLIEATDHTPGHFRGKQFLGDIVSSWARKLDVQSGSSHVGVEKVGGRYWVADAPRGWADDARVREVVKAIDDLRATRYLEGEALARVSGPALVASASFTLKTVPDDAREDQKPEAHVLTLYGACPEHGDERVARAGAAGDLVCVLSNDVRALLDLGDLREHHLLPADPTEVERFTLHGPGGDLDVKRKEAGWEAVAGGPVDDAAVEAWLAALRRVEGRYGPVQAYAAGAHTLSLTLASELRVAMAFSALPNGELGLVRDGEGLALTFAGDGPALVAAEAGRFTALTPFAAHKPSEVIAVSVRVGSTARKLALADGAFRAVGSAQPVADGIRVRELVRDLLKWQAAEYTGGAPRPEHGLQEPLAALAFGLAEGGTLALSVGARSGDTWAVSVVGRGVYRADGALLRGLYELAGAPIPSELAPTPPSADDDDEEPLLGHDHDEHAAHE